MEMKRSPRASFATEVRDSRGTKRSSRRVNTTRRPRACSRLARRTEMSRTTSFSTRPRSPRAPASVPPWPASITTESKRSRGAPRTGGAASGATVASASHESQRAGKPRALRRACALATIPPELKLPRPPPRRRSPGPGRIDRSARLEERAARGSCGRAAQGLEARPPTAGVRSRRTVYSAVSLNTFSGTQEGSCDMRGIPGVIAPVGSITHGSLGSSNHRVTM